MGEASFGFVFRFRLFVPMAPSQVNARVPSVVAFVSFRPRPIKFRKPASSNAKKRGASRGDMGGRAKAKGRGGGRGGGGGGRGRGRSAHGSGGRFGWGGGGGGGGRGSSSHRGDGLYGAEDAGDFVALKGAAPGTFFPGYGGGPKRKHRQMHQAYAHAEGGGRRVRKPDVLGDSDSDTTSEEQDGDVDGGALDVDHSDDSLGDSDPDPNVERNSVMRIGGIEIRMDRPGGGGGSNARRERFPPRPPARRDNNLQSTDDDDDREGSEWGSELSLDSDAIDDYMRNCMDDDTDTEEDEDADDASFDEERAADAAVAAAEEAWEKSERDGFDANDVNAREARRAAREERYLRRMRDMNLDGKEVPSPAVTDDESDEGLSDSDDSEAENEALKSGDYGTYRWGKGALKKKARGSLVGSLGGFPVSGKRAAKKAAKKAFKRGDSPEDFGLRRPRAVAETLAGMIRSGGAYIGFQSGMSDDALRGLLGIAHAMGLKAELRGGGKRRHAVVHWAHGARVPRDGDERLERAIASAEGEPYEGGGGGGGGGGVRGAFGVKKRNGSAPNFVSAGVMQNDDEAVTEGADDARVQNKGDAFTAVDADLRAEYEEVKKASFDRTDSHDLYSKYILLSVDDLQEQLTYHEKTVSLASNLPDGGKLLKDRIQLLKEMIPIKEREYKVWLAKMRGTVDAAEVEAELAAADADMRAAEAFLNAPEAGTDGDGDGDDDDGEEIHRSNRGLRRAALAAERELRAVQAQRRKKRGDGKVVGAGQGFGAFEAHTSGFGSRMLAKMGFQGEGSGVGKDGSGISEPITASMRAKRVGLGAER